jgi:hypothetical protein
MHAYVFSIITVTVSDSLFERKYLRTTRWISFGNSSRIMGWLVFVYAHCCTRTRRRMGSVSPGTVIAAVLLLSYAKIRGDTFGVAALLCALYRHRIFSVRATVLFVCHCRKPKCQLDSGSINATSPLFGLIIGMLIGDEKVRVDRIIGIFVGIAGLPSSLALMWGLSIAPWWELLPVVSAQRARMGYRVITLAVMSTVRQHWEWQPFSQTAAVLWLLPLAILYRTSGSVSASAIICR